MSLRIFKKTLFAVICLLIASLSSLALAAGQDMPTLKQGDQNEAVYALQTELKKLGFYLDSVDGQFGLYTKAAVIEFQQAVGMGADGVVGPETWQALRNFYGNAGVSRAQPDSRMGQQIATFAEKYLGVPYVWGGANAGGFDCSGFIYYVFRQQGISLPRMADAQYGVGRQIPLADIERGDLVFFTTYEPGPSHVGIYVGNGQFIHASSAAGQVTLTPLAKDYYRTRFLGAFRAYR